MSDAAGDLGVQAEALIGAGRHGDALVLLSVAQRSRPDDVPLLKLMSRVFIAQGRTELAIGALLSAVEIEPVDPNLYHALSILLFEAGRVHEAMAYGIQAFEQAPTAGHATALGAVLIDLGLYQEALGLSDHALGLDGSHWEALNNRALSLQGLGCLEDAVAAGQRAVLAAPANATVRFNLACAMLGTGQMSGEAWDLFEARLDLPGNLSWPDGLAARRWTGEDIAGRTILLHAEQGFGDTIQFIRYVPFVGRRAGRVIVAVQPPLLRLVREVMGVENVVEIGAPLPPCDVMAPLLSLPRLFGTTLDTIPLPQPWPGLPPGSTRLKGPWKVGLAWHGSRTFRDDKHRSIPAALLSRLAGIPGFAFVSLQKHDPGRGDLPGDLDLTDPMAGVTGFDQTAAIIAGLDLVISVDTAVGHLAATMGKPVWLLTRWRGCWRWMHGRTDSPWYPSIRLFRQTQPNDWRGAIEDVRAQLLAWSQQESCERVQ